MRRFLPALCVVVCAGCVSTPALQTNEALVRDVTAAEIAFAKTMADRDFVAFQTYIADEAIFMAGTKPLRGRDAVAAAWMPFFAAPTAPFAWKPDRVQVLDSGTLAKSSGPVVSPDGKVSQRFNSIWRLGADGRWRVIFDEGSPVCDCASK